MVVLVYIISMLQFLLSAEAKKNGFNRWAELRDMIETNLNMTYALVPASLAVTKGILVSFYYYAALTDMFKLSAYPRSS